MNRHAAASGDSYERYLKPTVDVTPGTPHVSYIEATVIGILPDQVPLPNLLLLHEISCPGKV